MRKSYSFKKLGLKIQRLAAIMLVTLMAVGNVFAEYDGTGLFTQINSLDELTSGYYVVTGTEENGDYAMLNTASGYINATTPVFFNPPANIVWRIDVDADGNVTFFNEEAASPSSMKRPASTLSITALVTKLIWLLRQVNRVLGRPRSAALVGL